MALLKKRRENNPMARRRSFWNLDDDFQAMMNRMFSGDWPASAELAPWREATFPKVDISEDAERVEVTAELPGIDSNDVRLEVTNDTLTLSGEKKQESEEEDSDKGWRRTERSYGYFRRVLPLPAVIDRNMVSAEFENGVLTVRMAKDGKEAAKTTIVPITTA